jgi:hypothetical protein
MMILSSFWVEVQEKLVGLHVLANLSSVELLRFNTRLTATPIRLDT